MTEPARKPRILLFSAGGTISMDRDARTGRSVPVRSAAELLALTTTSQRADIRCVDMPESLRDMRQPADLVALAHCLQHAIQIQDGVDGVVITHGTDTLEEVAYFIDEVFPPRVPLVFTGAMRPGWAVGYDGVRNLENAIRLASVATAEYGVLVTMNDEIFEAWSVYKNDTIALDGFAVRRGAASGRIVGDHIELSWRPASRWRFNVLPRALPASVPILTMGVGDGAALLDGIDLRVLQGIVIAGMGAGSIPPTAYERALTLAKTGLPVVLCSSASGGPTAAAHYYPGAYDELRAAGVAIENRLNARKARIRLLLSLGLGLPYTPFDLSGQFANRPDNDDC